MVRLLLLLFLFAPAARASVPEIVTPVVDLAQVLDAAAEERVAERLIALRAATGVQMAVLTVDTLGGQPIEDYALEVFTRWGGGSATRNDGALFVLAVKDRQNRLQLGYGLEVAIPDGAAATMLADLRPDLRAGDYGAACAGIVAAVANAVAHLTPESAITPAPIPFLRKPAAIGLVLLIAWLAGIAFFAFSAEAWRSARAAPAGRGKKKQKPVPWQGLSARLPKLPASTRVWVIFGAAPSLLLFIATLTTDLGFGLGYALCWYLFAPIGLMSFFVLAAGRMRAAVYLIFVVASVIVLWINVSGEPLPDGGAVAAASFAGAMGFTFLTFFFVPGTTSGSGSGSSSSYSSGSSSSSSSYSSSSSSSSSWSGGGGSSGGGGASSSW